MRALSFIALLLANSVAVTALGADLTKLDRTINKEPAYQGQPKYCLLVFGPEATVRAWLVIDSTVLYVDRSCNGDLTGPGKQVDITPMVKPGARGVQVSAGNITEPDGKTTHTQLVVGRYINMNLSIRVAGKRPWYAGYHSNDLQFADRPQDAPIIHFGGPLTLALTDHPFHQPKFSPGKVGRLEVFIGSPGLGKSTFAMFKANELPLKATWV